MVIEVVKLVHVVDGKRSRAAATYHVMADGRDLFAASDEYGARCYAAGYAAALALPLRLLRPLQCRARSG